MTFNNNLIQDLNTTIDTHYDDIDGQYENVETLYNNLIDMSTGTVMSKDLVEIDSYFGYDSGGTNPYTTKNTQVATTLGNQMSNINTHLPERTDSGDFLTTMDTSYNMIKDKINLYDDKREELKEKLLTYNNTVGRLNDARSSKYYILFIVWLVIFFVIMFNVFSNVVEEQKSMNTATKVLVFLFIAFIFYFIIKNTYMYFSGYT